MDADPYAKYGGKAAPAGTPAPSMLAAKKAALASEYEKAQPGSYVEKDPNDPNGMGVLRPGSTIASRAREAAIGILEPFTASSLLGAAKQAGSAIWNTVLHPADPRPLLDLAKGMVMAPIEPVLNYGSAVASGDWDKAANASGGILSQTVPAVDSVYKGAKVGAAALSEVGSLRERAREIAQGKVSAGSFETTEKIVDKYGKDSEAAKVAQAESDARVAKKNREAEQAAAGKTVKAQNAATDKNAAAMHEADIQTEQQLAKTKETNSRVQAQHDEATRKVQTHNAGVEQMTAQAETLDNTLRQGSAQLGRDVADLNKKLAEEVNENYKPIDDLDGVDDGIPLQDFSKVAREIYDQNLEGSTKKPVGFAELLRKPPAETEGAVSQLGSIAPMAEGVRFFEGQTENAALRLMQEQGLIDAEGNLATEGTNLTPSRLRRISSELGQSLSRGNMLRHEFRAVSALKEAVDGAIDMIAERNGVGDALTAAKEHFRSYKEALHDPGSAFGEVLERVGTLDPQHYSEPITKGKSSGVGIEKLRKLPTKYRAEVEAIANAAEQLRTQFYQRKSLKIPKPKEFPKPPNIQPLAPRAMAELEPIPEPLPPKVTPNEVVTGPTTPTVEEIVADKAEKARAAAHGLNRANVYDVAVAGGALYALAQGNLWTAVSVPLIRFGVPALLKSDGFIRFVSQPTAADLAAVAKLAEPARSEVTANLRKVISERRAQGTPLQVDPRVQSLITGAGFNPGVTNRRDALETLGRPVQ